MKKLGVVLVSIFGIGSALAQDWSRGASVSERANPYNLPAEDLSQAVRNGRLHALHYPVAVTGTLIPYWPVANFLEAKSENPLRLLLEKIVSGVTAFSHLDDSQAYMGLHTYPQREGRGPYFIPFKNGEKPKERMGFTIVETQRGRAFTVGCAECHAGNLFGRRVLGMTNRFPRANVTFVNTLAALPLISAPIFQISTGATPGEVDLFKLTKQSLKFVAAKKPAQLGLDTSLAQVALSLAKRQPDAWASRVHDRVREERLAYTVADSKPAVWWNLKYKNRWLSDGSVVSGNPIFTNFIWNEIGRGTDLRLLESWLSDNQRVVRDLTTAVFASEAPLWTDFFPASTIEERRAKAGEATFNQRCARCHGTYEKAWSQPDAKSLSGKERLKTVRVNYRTFVVDVGTDPGRYQGMRSLEQLNRLEISKRNGIIIEPQTGYVPPPLVGIWARWPYFHNNSAPTLCAVLTRASQRPVNYWAREANDPERDFDRECNGYPEAAAVRDHEYLYDTRREGMHASGHDEGIFLEQGREVLSGKEKADLIVFLQTL